MKAAVLLENLLAKTPLLNYATTPRPALPALSGVLIETEKGKIKMSTTDLDLGVVVEIQASIEEEGRALVPAKPFFETLSNLSEEKLTLEKRQGVIIISGKKSRVTLVTIDEGEFPKIIEDTGEKIMVFDKDGIEKEMARVVFSASPDSGRPAFSAVLVKKENDGVLMVATDSHRLSFNKTKSARAVSGLLKSPLLIPAKTIKAVLSQKNEEGVSVSVLEKSNQVSFSFDDTVVVGRLVEAEFPDFEKIIPDGFSTKAEFDRQEFLGALKSTSVFARDNANIVRLSVNKNGIRVFARSQSLGENTVDVLAKTTGEENEIAFNSRYLLELLQNISEDQMVFEMQGPLNPGVFKISGNPNFIHLIMPIRVKDEELQS